jgi:succinate-semialdehyde dehydrogenase / glutarate-semialdehyde dehydrogenase
MLAVAAWRQHLLGREVLHAQAFIAGGWRDAKTGARTEVVNPATGRTIATVPALSGEDVAEAIASAARALPDWMSWTPDERAKVLHRWADLIAQHRENLAVIVTLEQGKPLSEARGEVDYGESYLRWYAEQGKRLYGEIIPSHLPNSRLLVLREPIGVVAAILPWNFPSALVARKSAAALAAGCPVVLKPARGTPLSALAYAHLSQLAGIPNGVFSVVTAPAQVFSDAVFAAPQVRKVTFTGSTEIGRKLMMAAAARITRLSLELGGHAPCLVFNDADLETAVNCSVAAKFMSTGEDCLAINRVLVQEELYDAFCHLFSKKTAALKVGNGLDDVDQGPLFDAEVLDKCAAHVADALAKGARVLTGGRRHALGGLFYEPTAIADLTTDMTIFNEETFGPVAPIIRFRTEAEGIALANASPYGLAAYVFTRDMCRSWRVAEALEYSMVALNTARMTGAPVPFGGIKQSGLGREGGHQGLEEFTELKYFCIGGLDLRKPAARGTSA